MSLKNAQILNFDSLKDQLLHKDFMMEELNKEKSLNRS